MRRFGRNRADRGRGWGSVVPLGVALVVGGLLAPGLHAQTRDDCLMCHSDRELTGTKDGQEISVFVDDGVLSKSVHGELQCIACHSDLEGSDFPHSEDVQPVRCVACHEDVADELARGPHGKWVNKPGRESESCIRCHGAHEVLPPADPAAVTNTANV